MIDFNHVSGFDWDDANRDKNWIHHHVTWVECEELFFNIPLLLEPDVSHSLSENRFLVLGRTNAGRHLFLVFTVRSGKIRVISARDMSKKERASYEKENP